MKPTSPPMTYRPAYIGLFASLFLAAACNAFLNIQYGGFTFEMIFCGIIFGITIRIAWRQQGEVSEVGRKAQKTILIIGALMTVLIFIPVWGFPRAGLAMLVMLQSAQNCVTVNRRTLHMGLLVSAVMVMFAATHYRADWTMLFYLVPYIVAVVFTLVAEQISRRAQDLRKESLGTSSTRGQGVAITAATSAILFGGALLYNITPQVTWPYLFWKYGQLGNLGFMGKTPGIGQTGQKAGDLGSGGTGNPQEGQSGEQGLQGGQSSGQGNQTLEQGTQQGSDGQPKNGNGESMSPGGGWPSPDEMRDAAKRKGMPQWQSSAIRQIAGAVEMSEMTLTPLKLSLDELINDLNEWLKQHRQEIIRGLFSLIVLAMLIAAWLLLREARVGLWLRSRFDYLWLGLLRLHAQGNAGAFQYYRALQRLMDVHGLPREATVNTQEYLLQIGHRHEHLRRELIEMTYFFERARYSNRDIGPHDLARMRDGYRNVFRRIDQLA